PRLPPARPLKTRGRGCPPASRSDWRARVRWRPPRGYVRSQDWRSETEPAACWSSVPKLSLSWLSLMCLIVLRPERLPEHGPGHGQGQQQTRRKDNQRPLFHLQARRLHQPAPGVTQVDQRQGKGRSAQQGAQQIGAKAHARRTTQIVVKAEGNDRIQAQNGNDLYRIATQRLRQERHFPAAQGAIGEQVRLKLLAQQKAREAIRQHSTQVDSQNRQQRAPPEAEQEARGQRKGRQGCK